MKPLVTLLSYVLMFCMGMDVGAQQTEERNAKVGNGIFLGQDIIKKFETEGDILLGIPGNDILFHVTKEENDTPSPNIPSDAFFLKSGGDIRKAINDGKKFIVLENDPALYEIRSQIMMPRSGVTIYADPSKKPPRIKCYTRFIESENKDNITLVNLYVDGSRAKQSGIRFVNVDGLLIQQVTVDGFGSFGGLIEGYRDRNSRVLIDRSTFKNNYPSGSGHCSGLFVSFTDGFTMVDTDFLKNGGKPGKETVYNHGFYGSGTNGALEVHRCTFEDNSSHGAQLRSGGNISYNLFKNNPIGFSYGLVNGDKIVLGGVSGEVHHNVVIGGGDINGDPRGWPMQADNLNGAYFHDNLVAHDVNKASQPYRFEKSVGPTNGKSVGLKSVRFERNMAFDWSRWGVFNNVNSSNFIVTKPPKEVDIRNTKSAKESFEKVGL